MLFKTSDVCNTLYFVWGNWYIHRSGRESRWQAEWGVCLNKTQVMGGDEINREARATNEVSSTPWPDEVFHEHRRSPSSSSAWFIELLYSLWKSFAVILTIVNPRRHKLLVDTLYLKNTVKVLLKSAIVSSRVKDAGKQKAHISVLWSACLCIICFRRFSHSKLSRSNKRSTTF